MARCRLEHVYTDWELVPFRNKRKSAKYWRLPGLWKKLHGSKARKASFRYCERCGKLQVRLSPPMKEWRLLQGGCGIGWVQREFERDPSAAPGWEYFPFRGPDGRPWRPSGPRPDTERDSGPDAGTGAPGR